MEPLDAIFSSPEKSDGTDGEADMDLTTGIAFFIQLVVRSKSNKSQPRDRTQIP